MATKGRRAEKEEETGRAIDSFHDFDKVTYQAAWIYEVVKLLLTKRTVTKTLAMVQKATK